MIFFKRKTPLFFLIVLFAFTPFSNVYSDSFEMAPLNPEFIKYQKDLQDAKLTRLDKTSDGYFLGEIPSPTEHAYTKIQIMDKGIDTSVYASTYDLRNDGKVPPVRDQGSCGSCWTFATMASAESLGLTTNTWNFAEQDMNLNHGFDYPFCEGGNDSMATAYNSRWSGPLNEADSPYPYGGEGINIDQASSYPAKKHVQEVIKIPQRSDPLDNDTIKHFITTNGAVHVSFYAASYFSADDESYYNNVNTNTNHAVAAIGWDDDYAVFNFKTGTRPPQKGAFLIRNSWGTDRHSDGYFWLSYYDTSFIPRVSISKIESSNNYKSVYQYDPLGYVGASGYGGTTCWGANIFTATSNDKISAVGFHLNDTNATYEIYVYTNVTTGLPVSGTLAATKTGSKIYPGYYTVDLDSPVSVANGEKFSIVIKIINSGYIYPMSTEYIYGGYSSAATSNENESFLSPNGTSWTDLYNITTQKNNCIKAFTEKTSVMAPINLLLLN
jgi:C1A family cysteine protease